MVIFVLWLPMIMWVVLGLMYRAQVMDMYMLSMVIATEKKVSPFFWKICVKYFLQTTKRTLLKTSCSKKKCYFFWFTTRKWKARLYVENFDLNGKTLLIWFFVSALPKTESTCLWKKNLRVFVLSFSEFYSFLQNAERSKVFFSFCQDNNFVVQDNKTFFCFKVV